MPTERQVANRRLWSVMALSVLLHALVAFLSPARKAPEMPPPPLIASLRAMPVALHDMPASRPLAKAAPSPQARLPEKSVEANVPRRTPVAAGPAKMLLADQPAAATVAVSSNVPAAQSVVSEAAPAAAPQPVAPAGVQRERPDALAEYRRQLADLFAGRREYPRLAAMRGWEGEVRLRLRVARKGNLLAVQLEHSSGFEILDRYAQTMVEDLGHLPAMPEAMAQDELQIVVPINFKLRKTI